MRLIIKLITATKNWMKTKTPNLHGNLIQINHKGVLILGAPGIGKSTLTLDLLNRGYFFISDDLVSLRLEANNQISSQISTQIIGYRPESQARMHIRGQGFLDLDLLFPTQILSSSPIHFIIELVPFHQTADLNLNLNLNFKFTESLLNKTPEAQVLERLNQLPYCQRNQKNNDIIFYLESLAQISQ